MGGWYIATITDETGRERGYAIVDDFRGAFVRPLKGHPQSIFDYITCKGIEQYGLRKYGDPRKAEGLLDIPFRDAPSEEELLESAKDYPDTAAILFADWLETVLT